MFIENGASNTTWLNFLVGMLFLLGLGNVIIYINRFGKKVDVIDYESIIKDKDLTIEILERKIKQYQKLIDETR